MNSRLFEKVKSNWDDRVLQAENLLNAVGRANDEETIDILCNDISQKLNLKKENKLLEVGCGTGVFLSKLKPKVKEVHGLDYSGEAISKAKKAFPEIQFHTTDAINIPYEDECFDRVLCYSVFHYFPNKKYAYKAINELLRVCKNNGIILIGDLPSKKHKLLTPWFIPWYTKEGRSRLIKRIKRDVLKAAYYKIRGIPIPARTPPMINPKKWCWFDLDKLSSDIGKNQHFTRICEEPKIITDRFGAILYNHRFDLVIEKKLQKNTE